MSARRRGDAKAVGVGLSYLGDLARAEGDLCAARLLYREFLLAEMESRSRLMVATALGRLADLSSAEGLSQRSARLYGALDAWHRAVGRIAPYKPHPEHQRDLEAAHETLVDEASARAWAEGQAMTLEQAVEYALRDDAKA